MVIEIPFEIPWPSRKPARKPAHSIPAYSPGGDSDDRPNVLDARYSRTINDAPVQLPLTSPKPLYMVLAALAVVFVATMAGVVLAGSSSGSPTEKAPVSTSAER